MSCLFQRILPGASVGEKATDLLVFDKKDFVDSLFGGVK
jgi:hypothetical protein